MAWDDPLAAIDVEGPVLVEVFVLFVVDPLLVEAMESAPVVRGELARSGATTAPPAIATGQVLEHAVRHLAWLARDDEVVQAMLSEDWMSALAPYLPEPSRNLG